MQKSAKLGSLAQRSNKVIWYVDGFAGEGKYKDGSDGSPLLGLRSARHTLDQNRQYQLACFFIEKSLKRWRSLEGLVEPFRDNGVSVLNEHGEFSALVPQIAQETQGSPVLAFVDPFGISPLKYDQFRTLLHRRWPLDLGTFHHLGDWPEKAARLALFAIGDQLHDPKLFATHQCLLHLL